MAFDPNFGPTGTVLIDDDIEDDVDIIQPNARTQNEDDMDDDSDGGRKNRRSRKRAHDRMDGVSYLAPEDLLELRNKDHQAVGWRPVYSEEQERMMRWLALQNPQPQMNQQPNNRNGAQPHPGSARAAGYGSPFYQSGAHDPDDDPDQMT